MLDRLAATVGVDVRVVHVARNPYDTIATMHRRAPKRPFAEVVELFIDLAATVDMMRRRLDPGMFHEVHLDDVIADPHAGTRRGVCRFAGLDATDDYLDASASIVFDGRSAPATACRGRRRCSPGWPIAPPPTRP